MAERLKYEKMVEEALRGVVRRALQEAAARGLPGNHHFYITFRTDHPEAALAPWLKAKFPEEMTVVIQHQFWGLEVEDDRFSVTLTFKDQSERLTVPFAAVVGFADPSVKFGLQFEAEGVRAAAPRRAEAKEAVKGAKPIHQKAAPEGEVVALDAFRKK